MNLKKDHGHLPNDESGLFNVAFINTFKGQIVNVKLSILVKVILTNLLYAMKNLILMDDEI